MHPDVTLDDIAAISTNADTMEEIFRIADRVQLLIVSQMGGGKSTLINGLIGAKVAKVEAGMVDHGVTTKVEPHSKIIDNTEFIVYDSPGLEDGTGREKEYLDELYKHCHDADLAIFTVRMTNRFVPNNPDVRSMVHFTEKFTPSIWTKAVVVITCANLVEALNPEARLESFQDKEKFFQKLIADYKRVIHKTLTNEAKVPSNTVKCVKVIPAGIESQKELMDGTLWFSNLWNECVNAIPKHEARAAMIRVNSKRIKLASAITAADYRKPLLEQPIVIQESNALETLVTVIGSAVLGGVIGTAGVAAGPIGLIGIPVGLFAGLIIGSYVAAVRADRKKKDN